MADAPNFAKLVPGFDFLQTLVKNAGSALPSIGQWVAPTLDPAELEKRIEELRTVQFWLEQNARLLGATIQALEVQRMTLSTLKTMNVQMADLRDSLMIRMPDSAAKAPAASAAPAPARAVAPAPAPDPAPAPVPAPPSTERPAAKTSPAARRDEAVEKTAPGGVIDPMQWWGALTKQFTQLATSAMKDSATDAAKNLATSMVKQSFDAAGQTLRKAAPAPAKAARKATTPRRRGKGASG